MSYNKKDIELLFEISSMRHLQRSWRQQLGINVANDLEHTIRVIFLALLIARKEGGVSEEKIIKMALLHDLDESRTGDQNYIQRLYLKSDKEKAMHDSFGGSLLEDLVNNEWQEYEKRETPEAKIVKDADNLDVDLEIRELEEQGHQLPLKKWAEYRRMVRDNKLYTQSAKELWDALQAADPSDWHMQANKWEKDPNAGK